MIVITGYSDEIDGFVFVSQANTKKEAILDLIDKTGKEVIKVKNPKYNFNGWILAEKEWKPEDDLKWAFRLEIGKVDESGFADDAVQW